MTFAQTAGLERSRPMERANTSGGGVMCLRLRLAAAQHRIQRLNALIREIEMGPVRQLAAARVRIAQLESCLALCQATLAIADEKVKTHKERADRLEDTLRDRNREEANSGEACMVAGDSAESGDRGGGVPVQE